MIELLVNIVVGVEAVVALVLIVLCYREFRFLRTLKPFLPADEYLPLYDALVNRAGFVTIVGAYLIVLTVVGALVGPLSTIFPPLRAINGLMFLGLLAGPLYIGRALRRLDAARGSSKP